MSIDGESSYDLERENREGLEDWDGLLRQDDPGPAAPETSKTPSASKAKTPPPPPAPTAPSFRVARQHAESQGFTRIETPAPRYPYLLFDADAANLEPDDTFTLETLDGAYSEALPVSSAVQSEGALVLLFPRPPASARCKLLYTPSAKHADATPYYLFADEPVSWWEDAS